MNSIQISAKTQSLEELSNKKVFCFLGLGVKNYTQTKGEAQSVHGKLPGKWMNSTKTWIHKNYITKLVEIVNLLLGIRSPKNCHQSVLQFSNQLFSYHFLQQNFFVVVVLVFMGALKCISHQPITQRKVICKITTIVKKEKQIIIIIIKTSRKKMLKSKKKFQKNQNTIWKKWNEIKIKYFSNLSIMTC